MERLTIRVDGIDLNVMIAGNGPPVLLVHGFPDTHAVWRRQIPALVAAGYRVIAPDTRGCGDSAMPSAVADYAIDRLVADLVGVLDQLGIERVKLIGHDWGAVISWFLVLRHPERVERFLALSVGHPTAYAHGGALQKLRGYYIALFQLRGVIELLLKAGNWWLFRQLIGFPEEFPQWHRQLSRPGRLTAGINYYRANLALLWAPDMPRARVPVVCLWSDGDRFLVERQASGSHDWCDAGFTYERVSGANHWLQLDAPERVNPLLLKYLAASVGSSNIREGNPA